MAVQHQEQIVTAADLWDMAHDPINEGRRFELSEGVLIEMSPAGGKHGGFAVDIAVHVWTHVKKNDLGYVTAAETGYLLFKNPKGKDTVRAPDVGFVAKERLPDGLPDGFIPFAPDLAIEVVSPNDSADDIQSKLRDYLRYGTRMIWFFYSKTRTVNVSTPFNSYIVEEDGILDGGDVLPGFRLAVKDVFGKN